MTHPSNTRTQLPKINLKYFVLAAIFCAFCFNALAQEKENPKLILITLDGLRWQELFSGADSVLVTNKEFVKDTTELKKLFWRKSAEERRKELFPFLWSHVMKTGQIHGNRWLGSKVNLTNTHWFSYPGYNEILSGFADDQRINSNDKVPNPNVTFLEIANRDNRYRGKVAAFGSWDVFPFIINEERSGVPVNAGFESASGPGLSEREKLLNELQKQIPSPWSSVRLDGFTHHYTLEYLKKKQPDVVYIAYGETDDFAHDGAYDHYLKSAHTTDAMIRELWEFTQQSPAYKNNTLFVITTDHGRGTKPIESWKHHGSQVPNAGEVWLIAFGKGVSAKGEVKNTEPLFSNQIAPTLLKYLQLQTPQNMLSRIIEF